MNDFSLAYVFVICFLIFGVFILNMYISFEKEKLRKRNEYLNKYGEIFQNIAHYEKEKLGKHYKIENKDTSVEYVEVIDVDTGEVVKYYYDK